MTKEYKTITLNRSEGGYAYIVLDNYPEKLINNQVRLKSYRKINGNFEKPNEGNYNINEDLNYTRIKYSFLTNGEYALDIHDKDGALIQSAYVTVLYN